MRGGQTSALVVSADGIAPCVLENHGKVTAIVVKEKEDERDNNIRSVE